MNTTEQWCNDCKETQIFKINKYQEPYYYKGIRLRECIECGRYEEINTKRNTIKDEMKDILLVGKEKIGMFSSWRNKVITVDDMSHYGYQMWTQFINGAWGELDYLNVLKMKDATKREQRSFVISRYTSLLATEFNCSYGYAQKTIVGLFTKSKLASITEEFIDEMLTIQ